MSEYPSYETIVARWGYEVVATATFGSYQGDLGYVLRDEYGRVGVTVIGFGSCSGCDALEACLEGDHDQDEWLKAPAVQELSASLREGVRWYNTLTEAIFHQVTQPSEEVTGDWGWHDPEIREWVSATLVGLGPPT